MDIVPTLEDVLAGLQGVRKNGTGYMARCPVHDDRNPSLKVWVDDGGAVAFHCFAGCDHEAVRDALRIPRSTSAGDDYPSTYKPRGSSESLPIIAKYRYVDEEGRLLYVVGRTPKDAQGNKHFPTWRPDPGSKTGVSWKLGDTRRVLYRLPEVLRAVSEGEPVRIAEGEKDVDALRAAGAVATCNPHGAGKWRPEYSEFLRGALVTIVADKDKPGREHAAQVAASLRGVARQVVVVEAREGKDASDHLAAGFALGDFLLCDEPDVPEGEADNAFRLEPLDWQALLVNGVPEVEYVDAPYFPKGARVWVWGATGSYKSLFCAWTGARLSRRGVRVSYFSEENPVQEELRRLARLQPDPAYFRIFHRTGMDLTDERWVESLLSVTRGDAITFLDSWTDLWSGDENDNRAVQHFDARVLKMLQAQGTTPVVLHHTGHRYMFSDRGGATAGRGASSLGQKADVTLEFKGAGDDLFTIVYGKCRIGGIRQPERGFHVEDTEDGRVEIHEAGTSEERAVEMLVEKALTAILTAPQGRLTTTELKAAIGGKRERQTAALEYLEQDDRVRCSVEKLQTRDGKYRDTKVWRPARGEVGEGLLLDPDGERTPPNPSPLRGGEGFRGSSFMPSNPSPDGGEDLGLTSTDGNPEAGGHRDG